ncbi:hypothetical protein R3P38DRAFT_1049847 [Favolaschia claudopus]|uniref:Uncharacterized protein n=1 Tax=Favolaschia claudopus TaxID=2862362 RepID=A0AAW0BEW4_9AGAR
MDPISFFSWLFHAHPTYMLYLPLISRHHLQCTSFLFGGGRPPRPPPYSKAFRVFALRLPQSRIPALRGVPRLTLRPWSAASSVSVLCLCASRTSFSGNRLAQYHVAAAKAYIVFDDLRLSRARVSSLPLRVEPAVSTLMLVLCQIGRREGQMQPFFGQSWTLCTISSGSDVSESMDPTSGPIFLDTWPLIFERKGVGLVQYFPLNLVVNPNPALTKNSLDDLNDPLPPYCSRYQVKSSRLACHSRFPQHISPLSTVKIYPLFWEREVSCRTNKTTL